MNTDGSYLKKGGKNRVKEAVCRWRGSRNNPSRPSKCASPLPFGNVSSQKSLPTPLSLNAWREISDWRSCHFNTEKCTRMTNCRQAAPRYRKAARLCPLVCGDTFLSLCTGDRRINRALVYRGAARNQRSPARFEGLCALGP